MLEYYKLINDIEAVAENSAKRIDDANRKVPKALDLLNRLAVEPDDLQAKIAKALNFRWRGASFTDESIDVAIELPQPHPPRVNIVAADGSQVFPDRHGIALYYLINVGSIVFRYGVTEAPNVATNAEVFSNDDDLYEGDGIISPEKVSSKRNLRELAELASLSAVESETAPTVALLDNGLLPVFLDRTAEDTSPNTFIKNSLTLLNALEKHHDAAIAGVVDRPRASHVVSLLHLSQLDMDEIEEASLRISAGPFRHITDAALFRFLRPGKRSAVFITESWPNREHYEGAGQLIYFFYLNAGLEGNDSILRIEVPEWVAAQKAKLDLVHAAVYEQCKVGKGFPYVLMRADELAVVTSVDRQGFEDMIASALIKKGIMPSISQKQFGKRLTRGSKW